jgi:UrcA family protein
MHSAHTHLTRSALLAAVVAMTGAIGAAPPALAQPGAQAPTAQEVTVVAPKVARHEGPTASRFLGAPIEVVSLSRPVSFADLDLTKQSDVATFKARIEDAAHAACTDLEVQYPSTYYVLVPANQNCAQTATDQAMTVAKEVIAAVNGGTK